MTPGKVGYAKRFEKDKVRGRIIVRTISSSCFSIIIFMGFCFLNATQFFRIKICYVIFEVSLQLLLH